MPHNDEAATQSKIVQLALEHQQMIDEFAAPLDDVEARHYYCLIEELPHSEWSPAKLQLAQVIAKLQSQYNFTLKNIKRQGASVPDPKTYRMILNPELEGLKIIGKEISEMRAELGLHRTLGRPHSQLVAKNRQTLKSIEGNAVDVTNSDDLIARPGVNYEQPEG